MKKSTLVIFFSAILVCFCYLLIGCSSEVIYTVDEEYFGEYVPMLKAEKNILMDDGMIIDGKADEDVWNEDLRNWLNLSSIMVGSGEPLSAQVYSEKVDYSITAYLGEKGVYFYSECNDTVINSDNNLPTYRTAFVIYLLPNDPSNDAEISDFEYTISANGGFYVQKRFRGVYTTFTKEGVRYAASVKNGILNENGSGTAEGYSVELFVPWEMMGLKEKPKSVRAHFAAIRYSTSHSTSRSFEILDSSDWSSSNTWFVFDENGVVVN